jgi:hypothetical protein
MRLDSVAPAVAKRFRQASSTRRRRAALVACAAELDDEYFRLDEEGEPAQKQEALRLFSKARATSALVFALSGDEAQLHEAIYEAIAAMDDPGDLMRLIDGTLREPPSA